MGDAPTKQEAGQPSPEQDSESLTNISIRLGLPDGGEAHNTTRAVNSEISDDSRANYLHNPPGQTSAEKKCPTDGDRTVRSEDHDPKAQAQEPHKTKGSPQEPSVAAFRKLQKLRGGSRGLMLGTYFRGVAASLDVQSAGNAEQVYNMLLCSSHVTEMGFQLEEQEDKVAALEAQNDCKHEPSSSSRLRPTSRLGRVRKVSVPGQGTSGKSDQARQENTDIELSIKPSKIQAKQQEPSVETSGVSSDPDANEPKSGPKTTGNSPTPSSKAFGRSTKRMPEQPRGAMPRFMSPTAATKSRAPVSKSAAAKVVAIKPRTE